MRPGRRAAFALVGVAAFLGYAAAAGVVLLGVVAALSLDVRPAVALAVAAGTVLAVGYLSYRAGTARVLAQLNAVPLSPGRAPGAYDRLHALADRMGVEPPTLYVARLAAPNAVSLGGPGGAVVLDESLFSILHADEFEAVLAHELAHVERRDGLVQSLAYTVGRTLASFLAVLVLPAVLLVRGGDRLLAWASGRPGERGLPVHERVGRVVLVAVLLVSVLVRARSRKREFAADDRAVDVTGRPLALASALRKMERATRPRGLFAVLAPPRREQADADRWLSTHPAVEDRVERLRERASEDTHRVEVQ
ncbi:M48 family metallopeptidase [Halobacterium yunchengense]|uniref:M48 family metallopeptidase n=1 Tax=Halobacterium yunchengense TaxID=3108497 RepID=UPI003009E502